MSRDVVFHYLRAMTDADASDVYLTVDARPLMRVNNRLVPISDDVLSLTNIQALLMALVDADQLADFQINHELNTALDLGELGRFRINVLRQKHNPAIVIRRIATVVPSFDDLRLPAVYADLALARRGLVLVVGTAGSGKSTSLAAMVDYRNRQEQGHIITIEDPIEFYHAHKASIVTQREVGIDTHSYAHALKNALRQRPDVILIGEIRDRDVMEQALACAETGHLCLATVHANNAYQAIERVVNFFPEQHTQQVRMSLSSHLQAVLSQRLVLREDGGLVPAVEVLLNQGLVRDLILKGDVSKISEIMETNAMMGMRSFDVSLVELYRAGLISEKTVLEGADRPSEMQVKLKALQMQDQAHEESRFSDATGLVSGGGSDQGAALDRIDTTALRLSE